MRLEESLTIEKLITKKKGESYIAVNLGSGDINNLLLKKPWIEKNIFSHFKKKINIDKIAFDDIDIVGDLANPSIYKSIKKIECNKIFFLCNVLEHVSSKNRKIIFNNIYACMNSRDELIISVPYDYPYHADPIDTLYRPSPEALSRRINLKWQKKIIIESGRYIEEFLRMPIFKKIRRILKPIWILQKPSSYLHNFHQLFYLFKSYKVSIVYGIKP
jgi:hypothetical protein